MAERVARNRIIIGQGDKRVVIQPNTRFNPDDYGISGAELRQWEKTGVVRKLRDQTLPAMPAGPREQSVEGQVVEGRSGPVTDATSSEAEQPAPDLSAGDGATKNADRRVPRSTKRDDSLDDL